MTYKSLLITGTDTGIGKTTVSCIIAASLRRRGWRVGVLKPAETGCVAAGDGIGRVAQDALQLRYFADCQAPPERVCPYALRDPLAPLIAARNQRVVIDLLHIRECHRQIAAAHDVTLVEGAGGLLVPLADGANFVDLARDLGTALIVVVGNRLGAINHTLLTIEHARHAGLPVAGYIINQLHPEMDLAATTNADLLAELLGQPLGAIPFIHDLDRRPQVRDELARIGETCVRLDQLLLPHA